LSELLRIPLLAVSWTVEEYEKEKLFERRTLCYVSQFSVSGFPFTSEHTYLFVVRKAAQWHPRTLPRNKTRYADFGGKVSF
jgi:hypothetical protein